MTDEQQMVLRTEDLVKKYKTRTVVNHVSINVKQGEIVGLLGPNGAGKTTSFYMTVGLVTPNEGKIFLNDMEITKFPVYKRARNGIGYLAQEASIFRKMTVEDNIRSVLEMTETTPEYQKEKLESLIAEFGLNKVRKNLGDQLSGGERRRVALCRLLLQKPDILLLDEPTNDIDVNTLRALEEGLDEFAGCAVVVSHDRWFLDRICTHILSFEGDSNVVFYEGSYSEYEEHKRAQLGDIQPKRVRYRKLIAD